MSNLYVHHVKEAVTFIQETIADASFTPHVAITLGSGLGKLAHLIKPIKTIAYGDIPHFPQTTVPGHEGLLIVGHLEGIPIIGLKGRKHYYEIAQEPLAMDQVVFPVHVVASLGCKTYCATSASGGLNSSFQVGDLMVFKSHISFFLPNPLLGPHHDFGSNLYFQPQSDIYTKKLRETFKDLSPDIKEGVYCALTGRTYEAQAESLMLRKLGIDAVGMSTVPEIIVAHNRGMQTLGVSIITNVIAEDGTNATNHEEVMSILNSPETEEKLLTTFRSFFQKYKTIV